MYIQPQFLYFENVRKENTELSLFPSFFEATVHVLCLCNPVLLTTINRVMRVPLYVFVLDAGDV